MNRIEKETLELERLHPAASRSAESAGRSFEEIPDEWRTRYERDRDRIIHCSAFRRLMYKTQVFVNHVGDNQRTRLTHSLEVLQVSRSLASALNLNEPLCEAIALAHDLGHPPYGHSGEVLLNEKMAAHGGFAHNRQSLRIVNLLEQRSPEYRGLNLTMETQDCLKKHEKVFDPASGTQLRFPRLEGQLVDLADSTAYHYHDVDDGIREGILDPVQMRTELPLWEMAVAAAQKRHPEEAPWDFVMATRGERIIGFSDCRCARRICAPFARDRCALGRRSPKLRAALIGPFRKFRLDGGWPTRVLVRQYVLERGSELACASRHRVARQSF